jgi:hypothetical protein
MGDVKDSAVIKKVGEGKGGEDAAWMLIGDVEQLRKGRKGEKGRIDTEELERRILAELQGVMECCEEKFGTGTVEDARETWVGMDEKSKAQSAGMIACEEGWKEV